MMMEIIKLSTTNWNNVGPLTLTIGNFDGVHLGHQKLFNIVKSYKDTKSGALTLDPHPQVLFGRDGFQTLLSIENKIELLKEENIDYLFIADFNHDFASLSIDEFIQNLKDLGVVRMVIGRDARFAKNGSGTINDLKVHFDVVVVDDVIGSNHRISTSMIKELLLKGELHSANELLGYEYFIDGYVEHGNKVGKTLGFPTANIQYKDSFLPKNGVYLVKFFIDSKMHFGICNIGNNPTVNYSKTRKMEVYILDYDKIIYDKIVRVSFVERIRDEMKFNSKEELIDEMHNDEIISRNLIKSIKI